MYKISLIIFRESLEIALLLGIILAVTKNIPFGRYLVAIGCAVGVAGSGALALFAKQIASRLMAVNHDLFDIAIISLAIFVIISTIIWMQEYAGKIKKDFTSISSAISSGSQGWSLILITAITILREGAEIILYVSSISSASSITLADHWIAAAGGALAGFLTGLMFYLGLTAVAKKYIFKISSILLGFIAAGLASDVAGILGASGILTLGSGRAWDTSSVIADHSLAGGLLDVLLGYSASPSWLQVAFYGITLSLIFFLASQQRAAKAINSKLK